MKIRKVIDMSDNIEIIGPKRYMREEYGYRIEVSRIDDAWLTNDETTQAKRMAEKLLFAFDKLQKMRAGDIK